VLRKRFKNPWAFRSLMALASIALLPGIFIEKLFWRIESSWSWWLTAYLKGWQLSRQQPFDLIYSTGGAFAAHLAGSRLKNSLAIPWLAEVHDPLIIPGTQPMTSQQKMQAHVEGLICRNADVAIWFTDQALASAKARHPELGNRGHVLIPGIDPPFKILPPYHPGPKMMVGHFGSLSSSRNLVPFIEALEFLELQHPNMLKLIELHVYGGPMDPVTINKLASPTLSWAVKNVIKYFGRLEQDPESGLTGREQILRLMRSMDMLLLLHGEESICAEYIPSKLYEYLWMQRPILATVYMNPQMAEILRAQGHIAIENKEHEYVNIAQQLALFFDQWSLKGLPDSGLTSPHSTHASVAQLIQIFRTSINN
jgi:glycosyltransferase involved in cell wall biosynthesis